MKASKHQEVRRSRTLKSGYVQKQRSAGGRAAATAASASRAAAGASALGGSAGEQALRFSQTIRSATPMAGGAGTGMDGASAAPVMTEGGLPGGIGNSAAVPAAAGAAQAAAGAAQQAGQAQWNAANYKPENWFSRIGGMEGVMTGMSNVQKLYGMYKQLQPMAKWLSGLGGGFGATAAIQSVAKGTPRHRKGRSAGKSAASGGRGTIRAGKKSR